MSAVEIAKWWTPLARPMRIPDRQLVDPTLRRNLCCYVEIDASAGMFDE
jgi:hypothetical protein